MELYRYLFILMGIVFKGQFQRSVLLYIGKGQGIFRRRREGVVFSVALRFISFIVVHSYC